VPYTRGAEVSRPVAKIVAEVERLAGAGVREITLIGQNVNGYHGEAADGRASSLGRLLHRLAQVPGVARLEAQRLIPIVLDSTRPAVTVIARPIVDPGQRLPLVGALIAPPPAATPIYVSEAVEALYGAHPGTTLAMPLPSGGRVDAFVAGVWRDYARQHGAILVDSADFIRWTGDDRANDLAIWLAPGVDTGAVQTAIRAIADDAQLLEFARPAEIRKTSLAIFDRSFAVTRWLQVVAIGIGLAGIAASFSAQALARRREFGLLVHLGMTRAQVLRVVAIEALVWASVGVAIGVAVGLGVSIVLVHVVNPQSFHWTMELHIPWLRLAVFAVAMLAAATGAASAATRAATGHDVVSAVKEDW